MGLANRLRRDRLSQESSEASGRSLPVTRLLLAAAVVCALVSSPRRAEACWNNYSSESKVLGVANDGSFATYETSWSEAGDGASHEIVVHDAHGERIESFSLDPGRDTWIHAVEKSARASRSWRGSPWARPTSPMLGPRSPRRSHSRRSNPLRRNFST